MPIHRQKLVFLSQRSLHIFLFLLLYPELINVIMYQLLRRLIHAARYVAANVFSLFRVFLVIENRVSLTLVDDTVLQGELLEMVSVKLLFRVDACEDAADLFCISAVKL